MIRTGLPYKFDEMQQIQNEGAVVDMSDINYPSISKEDNVKTTYIYLRNTGFDNISLDFSNTPYSLKKEFMEYYVNGLNKDLEIKELSNTLLHLLLKYCNVDHETAGIFTPEEDEKFIEENKQTFQSILELSMSLPILLFTRLDCEDFSLSFDDIEETDETFAERLLLMIIRHREFNLLFSNEYNIKPKMYKNLFVMDNERLFNETLSFTPFGALLYGIANEDEWKTFSESLKQVTNELK